jgi:hypothetical protein
VADHLVAQRYQRRWANRRNQVVLFDLQEAKATQTSIKNSIAETHFYAVHMEDGSRSDGVERTISETWEHNVLPVLRALDSRPLVWPLSAEDQAALASFLALQAVRGRRYRKRMLERGQRMAELFPRMDWGKLDTWEPNPDWPEGPPRRKHADLTAEEMECIQLALLDQHPLSSQNHFVGAMLAAAIRLAPFYMSLSWDLLVSNGGDRFITSDEPVRTWRDPEGPPPSVLLPFPPTDEITVPLGPTQCLRLYLTPPAFRGTGKRPQSVHRLLEVDGDVVAIVNGRTKTGADRFLVFEPGSLPREVGSGRERLPIEPPQLPGAA